MDDVEVWILTRLDGLCTVIHAHDNPLTHKGDERSAVAQHLLVFFILRIGCCRLHLTQFLAEFVAFMFSLEQTI